MLKILHTQLSILLFTQNIFGNPKICSYYARYVYIPFILGENVHITHISENLILRNNCSHPYLLGLTNNLDPNPCIFSISSHISERILNIWNNLGYLCTHMYIVLGITQIIGKFICLGLFLITGIAGCTAFVVEYPEYSHYLG